MKKILMLFGLMLVMGISVYGQQIRISGTVTDGSDGSTLPGVTVLVKGTTTGTTTDMNGRYELNTSADAVLVFTFIGMVNEEVAVANRPIINVTMMPDIKSLSEVVVVGYGTAREVGTVIGSISTVKSDKLQDKPSANAMDALQGKVAGLQVYSSSGEPSQSSSIRLHGVGSLGASNVPLYVLDGIPIGANNVLGLNPNDFESVTVLKDASATSIYGSRAANGVIFITTKSGTRDSKAKITVNAQSGSSSLANTDYFENFMNTTELTGFWLETGVRNKAEIDKLLTDYPNDTQWYKYYYKESAPTYQGDIAIQGGSNRTRYYVSGAYFFQDGLAYRSAYERYSMRANVNSSANDWLSFGSNIGLSTDERQTNPFGTNNTNRGLGMLAQPFYSPLDENGKRYEGVIPGWGRYDPVYLAEKQPGLGKNNQGNISAFVQINPIEGLTIKSQGGIDGYFYRSHTLSKPSFLGSLNNGNLTEYFSQSVTRTLTNTAEYKFRFNNRHNFIALVGQESVDNAYEFFQASSTGLTDDRLLLLTAGPNNRNVGHGKSEYAFLSYFGRLDYNLSNKYFADFSLRQDASSRFGKDNRTAMFYAAGVMWNAKREDFLRNNNLISALQMKASIGTSGNSEIGNYTHLAMIGTAQYDGGTGWLISTPGNPTLQWESQQKFTTGAKIAFLDRFRFDVEFYNRTTASQLISVPYPYTSGFISIMENTGSISNTGIDVDFNFDVLRRKDFYVTPYFNINYNKNKVTELFQDKDFWVIPNTGVAWAIGQPIAFFYPIFAGIDPADGMPMWYVPGEDRSKTRKEETTKVFNNAALQQNTGIERYAPIAGGFGLNAGYKGFDVSVDFAYVEGKYLINNDRYFFENPNVFGGFNQSKSILDYWKEPGDQTAFPKYGVQFMQFDSRLIEDASFIRMKNITLSYTLPKSLVEKTGLLTGSRVFVTGRNLLTFSNYSGPDPEVDSNLSLGANPNTKQVSMGLSFTF
jgi:TonB-linked SusC/RagA family outer membrane protein